MDHAHRPAKLPADVIAAAVELSKKALESDDLRQVLDLAATAIWRSPADTLAIAIRRKRGSRRLSKRRRARRLTFFPPQALVALGGPSSSAARTPPTQGVTQRRGEKYYRRLKP